MISSWIADGAGVRMVTVDEATAAWKTGATIWIDLDCEEEESVCRALEPLGIHPLVLDDMVVQTNRPKVDNYGAYVYLVVHSARWDESRPSLRELDLLVGERFLVTYHDGQTRSVMEAREVLPRRPELLSNSPAHLLHYLLDVLVDHYLPIADHLAEEIDALEEGVLEQQGLEFQQKVVHLKRGIAALRRIIGPERDTVLALTRDEFRPIPAELRPYLRDVYDRLARISDLLDSFRDETASILELHVSVVSNRMNEVIKRLTVIATIGLPLTVVTSYYGMNFPLPEYRFAHAELFAVGLMVLTGLATWVVLRWKKWL